MFNKNLNKTTIRDITIIFLMRVCDIIAINSHEASTSKTIVVTFKETFGVSNIFHTKFIHFMLKNNQILIKVLPNSSNLLIDDDILHNNNLKGNAWFTKIMCVYSSHYYTIHIENIIIKCYKSNA